MTLPCNTLTHDPKYENPTDRTPLRKRTHSAHMNVRGKSPEASRAHFVRSSSLARCHVRSLPAQGASRTSRMEDIDNALSMADAAQQQLEPK